MPRAPLPQGLPRARRVRKRSDFVAVQTGGHRVTSPAFVWLTRHRNDEAPGRLGVTVTRKVGGAVVRNRIKRLLREAFRRQLALVPAGADWVVVARDRAVEADLRSVTRELVSAAPRLAAAPHAPRTGGPPAPRIKRSRP